MNKLKMIITDFDGTLFSDDKKINKKDYETLLKLGEMGIKRVVATGRSVFSAKKVINNSFPIDYLIFSTGAGIMKWRTGEIIRNICISSGEIKRVYKVLEDSGFDFMLHKKIPDNHYFYKVKQTENINLDFERRCTNYSSYCLGGSSDEIMKLEDATQFVVIKTIEKNESPEEIHNLIVKKLPELKVIRVTSPLDGKSLWMEIFHPEVSKAKAADEICERKKIQKENVMVIGNDYNDIDMLEWGGENSFVVENAPEDFKQKFRVVSSNNKCGFSEAVDKWLSYQL